MWGLLGLLAAGDLPGGEEGMGPTRERWGSRGREASRGRVTTKISVEGRQKVASFGKMYVIV